MVVSDILRLAPHPPLRVLSYSWAWGPPIGMKMRPVCVYAHVAWTAKVVCTLDEVRPFLSLIGNARFEPICVAPALREGGLVARDGV